MGIGQQRLDRVEQGFERHPSKIMKMAGNGVEQRESRVKSHIPSEDTAGQIVDCAQKEAPAGVRKSLLSTIRQKSFRPLRVIPNKR